jgi:hypothetical protein
MNNIEVKTEPLVATINNELFLSLDKFFDDSIRIPNKSTWIFLCGYAIGETALFCTLAKEFLKTHGHEIILLVTQKHIEVAKMYQHNFIKIVIITDDLMRIILRSNYIPQDRLQLNEPVSPCWIDRGFRDSDGIKYLGRFPGRGGISETDMMRFTLRLPWNSKLERPRISVESEDSAWLKGRTLGLRVGRSVLLCPINNSANKFPDSFWIKIATKLKALDYVVFTNMGGLSKNNGLNEMPIQGTIPVDLSIDEVIPFANYSGRVITGGNGMSFLTMLGCSNNFNMTQLLPYSINSLENNSSLGYMSHRNTSLRSKSIDLRSSFQYLAPELCLYSSLSEFLIPFDGDKDKIDHLVDVVVHQDKYDSAAIKRNENSGLDFISEQHTWLRELV